MQRVLRKTPRRQPPVRVATEVALKAGGGEGGGGACMHVRALHRPGLARSSGCRDVDCTSILAAVAVTVDAVRGGPRMVCVPVSGGLLRGRGRHASGLKIRATQRAMLGRNIAARGAGARRETFSLRARRLVAAAEAGLVRSLAGRPGAGPRVSVGALSELRGIRRTADTGADVAEVPLYDWIGREAPGRPVIVGVATEIALQASQGKIFRREPMGMRACRGPGLAGAAARRGVDESAVGTPRAWPRHAAAVWCRLQICAQGRY
jgi:hypothetical protein